MPDPYRSAHDVIIEEMLHKARYVDPPTEAEKWYGYQYQVCKKMFPCPEVGPGYQCCANDDCSSGKVCIDKQCVAPPACTPPAMGCPVDKPNWNPATCECDKTAPGGCSAPAQGSGFYVLADAAVQILKTIYNGCNVGKISAHQAWMSFGYGTGGSCGTSLPDCVKVKFVFDSDTKDPQNGSLNVDVGDVGCAECVAIYKEVVNAILKYPNKPQGFNIKTWVLNDPENRAIWID
jgi:hypothetical protein